MKVAYLVPRGHHGQKVPRQREGASLPIGG